MVHVLPPVLRCDPNHPSKKALARAKRVLERSGVVILPTDSVYGVGCAVRAHNPALARIFAIKRRDPAQTLPLLLAKEEELERWAQHVPSWACHLAKRFWPGALTLVVEASGELPPEYVAQDGSVGLRVPRCALVQELVVELNIPLAVTSANLHGEPAIQDPQELSTELWVGVNLFIDGGPAPLGEASTVVDARGAAPRILREGAIAAHELTRTL